MKLSNIFIDNIPDEIDNGTLYVSIKYHTAIHICPCGCGNKVVTPISPIRWKLTFDGETVTLYPSIGNWSLPCKSHYWIRNNEVLWSRQYSTREIDEVREEERQRQELYYKKKRSNKTDSNKKSSVKLQSPDGKEKIRKSKDRVNRM
jgi:hypothetical protein